MIKRVLTELAFVALIIALILLHTAQLQWSEGPVSVHWIIVGAICVGMISTRRGIAVAMIAGVLTDLQAATPFGIGFLALILSFTAMRFSYEKLFNQFALYTVIINGLVWTLLNTLFLLLIIATLRVIDLISLGDFQATQALASLAWQLLSHSVLLTIAFYVVRVLKNSFVRTEKTQYA